ncbi:MAG: hypothetical protein EZS28_036534 [Streblomastix strix]|uniref:Uncharacterized protein n=1 Tax=Streblomastix strix TaxID=222440 RepID=A0A5J4UBM6_9EUKA|nr:MAG: hypothetical protein EZS28_036534 [Streblomastix strix]
MTEKPSELQPPYATDNLNNTTQGNNAANAVSSENAALRDEIRLLREQNQMLQQERDINWRENQIRIAREETDLLTAQQMLRQQQNITRESDRRLLQQAAEDAGTILAGFVTVGVILAGFAFAFFKRRH